MADTFQWAGFSFPRRIVAMPHGSKADRLNAARAGNACGPYYSSPKPIIGGAHGAFGFYLGECRRMRWTWADDISGAGIRHKGWLCDGFGGETIRGIVVRLTHGRILAGWSMGEGMCASIECDEIFTDEIAAARCADGLAESVAEKEREYQERRCAAQDLSDAAQEAQKQIRRLWSARHNEAVRELIRSCIITARDSREQLTNEYSDMEV